MPRGGAHTGAPVDPERADRLSLHRAILRSVGATEQQVTTSRNLSAKSFQERFGIDAKQYDYLKEHRLGRTRFGPEGVARAWVASRGGDYWLRWYGRFPAEALDKVLFRFDQFVTLAQAQGKDTAQFYNDLESGAKAEHMTLKKDSTLRMWAMGTDKRDRYGRRGKGLDVWGRGDEGGTYWETP